MRNFGHNTFTSYVCLFVFVCVCVCIIYIYLLNWKYYANVFLSKISCCLCVYVFIISVAKLLVPCLYGVCVYNKICVCSVGSIMLMFVYVVFVYIMCLLSSWKYYFSVLFSFYYTVVVGLGYKRYGLIGP